VREAVEREGLNIAVAFEHGAGDAVGGLGRGPRDTLADEFCRVSGGLRGTHGDDRRANDQQAGEGDQDLGSDGCMELYERCASHGARM